MSRILFYAKRNLHLPHLEPIRAWIAARHPEVDVRISSPDYIPSGESRPGEGLTPDQIRELQARGVRWIPQAELAAWRPEVTVLADADFAGITWGGRIANVNHGLISKGWYYTTDTTVQRENTADLICVPGPWHADVLRRVLRKPVVPTGLVKFDPIGRGEWTQAGARRGLGVPEDAQVVCFAPTFNMELSGVPVVTDRVRELVREGRWLLIKLHGMSPSIWTEMYRLLSRLEERIVYVEDTDLTPSLLAADVVISDVSSAFMEAMALDRPVVLVDNPFQTRYPTYDPSNIEYAWRDVGLRARTAAEVIQAVDRSFARPEEKAAKRREYGPQLVGPLDGRAAERAGQALLELAKVSAGVQAG